MPIKRIPIEFVIEVIIEPDETGFHAYCPALKGLHTCGDTEKEALRNVSDAAEAYIKSLIKHRDPIPVGIIRRREIKDISDSPESHINRHTEAIQVACVI